MKVAEIPRQKCRENQPCKLNCPKTVQNKQLFWTFNNGLQMASKLNRGKSAALN